MKHLLDFLAKLIGYIILFSGFALTLYAIIDTIMKRNYKRKYNRIHSNYCRD